MFGQVVDIICDTFNFYYAGVFLTDPHLPRYAVLRIGRGEIGRKMVANIVMLGFLAALNSSVSADALRRSVRESVPKGSENLNLGAFERGYEYGKARTPLRADAA